MTENNNLRLWAHVAEVDGLDVIQLPVYGTKEAAEQGLSMYGEQYRDRVRVVPLAPELPMPINIPPLAAPELWAVHVQGPDELYAAFSREDADQHAAVLNALPVPPGVNAGSLGAVVIRSPWPEAEHWRYLAEQERDHKNDLIAAALKRQGQLKGDGAALPRPAAVVDEGDEGQWADILPDVSVKVGQHLYAAPPAPAAALDVMQFQLKHPVNGETRTVEFTRAEIAALVESEIFEKLADQLCECGGPVGETNHVDHNCDEYADEFELIAAPLDGKGEGN